MSQWESNPHQEPLQFWLQIIVPSSVAIFVSRLLRFSFHSTCYSTSKLTLMLMNVAHPQFSLRQLAAATLPNLSLLHFFSSFPSLWPWSSTSLNSEILFCTFFWPQQSNHKLLGQISAYFCSFIWAAEKLPIFVVSILLSVSVHSVNSFVCPFSCLSLIFLKSYSRLSL